MKFILVVLSIFLFIVIYVNIKVTIDISRSTTASEKERVLSYIVVWLIPLIGVFFVPKRMLPRFWSSEKGQNYSKESGGGFPGAG